MIVRELLTKLVFDADQKKVASFEDSVKSLSKGLVALVGAATAATGAAFRLARSTAAYSASLTDAADVTGFSTRVIQGLGYAAEVSGSSVAVMNGALDTFNRRVGAAADGSGPAVQTLKDMNIQLRDAAGNLRSNEDLLSDVADRFAGISDPARRANYAQQLFNAQARELGVVLSNGSDGLRQFIEDYEDLGGMLSDKDVEAGAAFDKQMTIMRMAVEGVKREIGTGLIPVFSEMIKQFLEFLRANRELIITRIHRVFEMLISVVRVASRVMGTMWRAADRVAQSLGGWEETLRLILTLITALLASRVIAWVGRFAVAIGRAGGVLGALRLAMLAIPQVAFLAALALMLDEIWNWVSGNESAIEKVLGTWESFRDKMASFSLLDVVHWTKDLQKDIEGAFGRAFDRVREMWNDAVSLMRDAALGMLPDWVVRIIARDSAPNTDEQIGGSFIWGSSADLPVIPQSWDSSADLPIIQSMSDSNAQGVTRVINDNRQVTITTPPGSTQEQVSYIERAINRTLGQQIDAAALTLETR